MGRISPIALGFVALLFWGGVGFVVEKVSPAEVAGRLLFFALFYAAMVTTLGLIAYILSFRLFASKAIRGNLGRSLQHGGLWATFAVAAASLQLFRMLSWINGALLLGLLAVAQILMLARQHQGPESGTRARRRWEEVN